MSNLKVLLDVDLINGKKRFFHLYLDEEDLSDLNEIDQYIANHQCLFEIVDEYGPIYDWKVILFENIESDKRNCEIEETIDPKKKLEFEKKQAKITRFEQNLKDYKVKEKDIETDVDKGILTIKNDVFGKIEIPLLTIYSLIEKDSPEETVLTNSFGETILNLIHGSFLNAGLADIQVFDSKKDLEENSFFNPTAKGGIFIRKDGRIDIGNVERTRYLNINLSALVKELYLKKLTADSVKFLNTSFDKT